MTTPQTAANGTTCLQIAVLGRRAGVELRGGLAASSPTEEDE
jgi:hypothetical protein